jgi:hypothetical protein
MPYVPERHHLKRTEVQVSINSLKVIIKISFNRLMYCAFRQTCQININAALYKPVLYASEPDTFSILINSRKGYIKIFIYRL